MEELGDSDGGMAERPKMNNGSRGFGYERKRAASAEYEGLETNPCALVATKALDLSANRHEI